jgi:exosome complex exonuclease DIS3/RRP44
MDLIQNCPVLRNVVVFQTIFEELNSKKPSAFTILKNLIEVETYRKFYIFPNEFFESTHIDLEGTETIEQRNERAILKAALYYKDHLQALSYILFRNYYIKNGRQQKLKCCL